MPRRDRSGSEDQDKEASAGTQHSAEATAEANEQAQDSEAASWPRDAAENPRPNIYSRGSGSKERYGRRAGDYSDGTYRRDEKRRATGRFGERADYEYDERGYGYWSRPERAADDRGWYERASDAVASWFGDEEAERRLRMNQRVGQNRGKGPKGYRRSDERIREDVNDRLSDNDYVDASDIEVQANEGEVLLTGTVSSREERRRAEDIAESVSGVTNVENRLRVNRFPREQDLIPVEIDATSDATADAVRDEDRFLDHLATANREGNISLVQTVREVIQEESVARNYVTARYRSLIDRKYLHGLSPSEENELEALEVTLEEMDQPYYQAIGERLRALLDQS